MSLNPLLISLAREVKEVVIVVREEWREGSPPIAAGIDWGTAT
jgi:hypothetical protein